MNDPMLNIVHGIDNESATLRTDRKSATPEHIQEVRKEFIGKPEVCAEISRLIILCRRGQHIKKNYERFLDLAHRYNYTLMEHLTARWLVSMADTYFFHGTPVQSKNALIISTYMCLVTIMDTQLFYMDKDNFVPTKELTKGATEYGCIYYRWRNGNTVSNNISRINKELRETPELLIIWTTLLNKLKTTRNAMSDMAATQQMGTFW